MRRARRRFAWIARVRSPLLLALAAGGFWLLRERFVWPQTYEDGLAILTRMALVGAAGWLATSLVDLMIARRMSRLALGEHDNLAARKSATRLDVMRRIVVVVGMFATIAAALTVIPWARQIGVSLFASAGIAGIALGLAARPILSNLLAGLQIAFTQPVRIEDAVVLEDEWGWIEEIGLFYVVVRLWDWRRLIVPLSYFIEKPFQNWTRESASIIGTTTWCVDYRTPVAAMRERLTRICEGTPLWDGKVVNLQVTEADARAITVRALSSARTSPEAWDLRCHVREEMIAWLQEAHPEALPRVRAELSGETAAPGERAERARAL